MVSFDDICKRIFSDPRWAPNTLIGGLLSFVPILNIFALGYHYRYFAQVHRGGGFEWPDWNDWERLFFDGLRFLAIIALFGFLPVAVVALGAWLLALVTAGFVNVLYLFVAPVLLVAPLWVIAMLYVFQPRRRWEILLRPRLAWELMRAAGPALLVPALAFWGLAYLGRPVYGLAFFLGIQVLGAYYTRLFLEIESRAATNVRHG